MLQYSSLFQFLTWKDESLDLDRLALGARQGAMVLGRSTRIIKLDEKPTKRRSEKLPWPRKSSTDPNIDIGVDVVAKEKDIVKIVHKFFRVPDITMEELLQEVFLAIIHKNHTRSAHDPTKSSFGHYVYMVANNVCINLVYRKQRYEKEKESLDAQSGHDDRRSLLETVEAPTDDEDPVLDRLDEAEEAARRHGLNDVARYVRAAKSGASPEIIREAMSWGERKVTTKDVRDWRIQFKDLIESMPLG